MKLNWVNFLHIYQPPHQDGEVLERVLYESYEWILQLLEKNPQLKLTINISACLTEQFMKRGYHDFLNRLFSRVKSGQVELVGTAAYHPILPLLPESEIRRQIQLNNEMNSKFLGKAYKPKGFYLPEMAFDRRVAKILEDMGFEWVILDEIAAKKTIDYNTRYTLSGTKLKVVFRDRDISKTFVPQSILDLVKESKEEKPHYIVTATDGEVYGHHHSDWDGIFNEVLLRDDVTMITVSQYLNKLKTEKNIAARKSSWESMPEEVLTGNPFALWNDPDNPLHKDIWKLAHLAIKLVEKNQKDSNFYWARYHLDRGLCSCTFWWCSSQRPSPFCPITWNPDEVGKGLQDLIKSIRSLKDVDTGKKVEAEKLYYKILKNLWSLHWEEHQD